MAVSHGSSARDYPVLYQLFRVFGPLALFAVSVLLAIIYLRNSCNVRAHYPDFIVLVSVAVTAIYSFVFLIAPEFHKDRGLPWLGVVCLAILLVASFLVSGTLFSVYVDRTFMGVVEDYKLHVFVAASSVLEPILGAGGVDAFRAWIMEYHFAVYVGVFSLIDIVFCTLSPKRLERLKFRRVILFIDFPIACAIAGIVLLRRTVITDGSAMAFESGAIGFQLMSGSVAAYLLDNYIVYIRWALWTRGEMAALWHRIFG
jgi:hypothetical protein